MEYIIVKLDHAAKAARVSLRADELLGKLIVPEEKMKEEVRTNIGGVHWYKAQTGCLVLTKLSLTIHRIKACIPLMCLTSKFCCQAIKPMLKHCLKCPMPEGGEE